jgi:hypothetical protein
MWNYVLYNYVLTKVFSRRGRRNGWRPLPAHIKHVRKVHIDFKHFIGGGLDKINTLSFLLVCFQFLLPFALLVVASILQLLLLFLSLS